MPRRASTRSCPTDMPVVCFYPMSKARGETRNWYTLPFEERKRLMGGHGATGRKFAGRVLQLITSCTGLDDWEWGVTLFARDLKSIRDVVYEMRFDPGSAVYGLFGEFYVALRFQPDELADVCSSDHGEHGPPRRPLRALPAPAGCSLKRATTRACPTRVSCGAACASSSMASRTSSSTCTSRARRRAAPRRW